jgi:hypothetical protein
MREIPIEVAKASRSYPLQIIRLVTDLWLYFFTDTRIQFGVYMERYTLAERFSLWGATKFGWAGLLITLAPALAMMIAVAIAAFIATIIHNLIFTLLILVRKVEFVPASEVIKAELEKNSKDGSP